MSKDYWAERQAQAQANLTKKSIKDTKKQLAKYYSKAMKSVINDFEATYNKLSAYFGTREITPADLYNLDRYWELQGQLQTKLEKLGYKEIALYGRKFKEAFGGVYSVIALPSGKQYHTISDEVIEQMINSIWCADGKSWSSRVWTNVTRLRETLNDNLINCVLTGKRTRDLKKILQESFDIAYYRADSIVRTEMAHIQTEAAKKRYEDYGIKRVEIFADKDERQCPECGKLHGTQYFITEKVPIPAHPNCRCCVVPVIE